MGSRSVASFEASPSKYVPRSGPIRPIALSRFDSSNSSVHERPQPAPVAEELLQRPRQPPVAVGEVGAELLERRRRPLVGVLGLADEALELAPDGVHVDAHACVLERHQADLQGALDESGRSAAGRSATNAARLASARTRRSTTTRSRSTTTRDEPEFRPGRCRQPRLARLAARAADRPSGEGRLRHSLGLPCRDDVPLSCHLVWHGVDGDMTRLCSLARTTEVFGLNRCLPGLARSVALPSSPWEGWGPREQGPRLTKRQPSLSPLPQFYEEPGLGAGQDERPAAGDLLEGRGALQQAVRG